MSGTRNWRAVGLVVVVSLIMMLSSSIVLLGSVAGNPVGSAHASSGGVVSVSGAPSQSSAPNAVPATAAPAANGPVETSTARVAGVAAARQAFLAAGGNLADFFPPSVNAPTASPATTGGHVVPLFDNTPAPMGIATYGLRNSNGVTTPYVLNTKSVEGSFYTNDPTGVQTQAYDFGGQTSYGAQLNVIETNTTLYGQTGFLGNTNQFWLQNVIGYNTATSSLSFDLNIWNFSYNPQGNQPWAGFSEFPSHTILHGLGSVSGGELYEKSGPSITVSYPFTLQLYINTTVGSYLGSPMVDEVYFNYSVWNSAGVKLCPTVVPTGQVCNSVVGGMYDNVYFNSQTNVNPNTAQIQANGYHYASNGGGTNLDMELDYGIGGSDAAIALTQYADAQLGLFTLNASSGKYQTVPSAYDFGSETGESTQGSYGTWSVGSNGAPVEQLRTGPSILTGLWNASANPAAYTQAPASSPGAYALNYQNVQPQNAWVAVAPGSFQTNQEIFRVAPTFGWFNRPTSGGLLGPNMWLQPEIYTVEVMLSGYTPVTQTVNLASGGASLNIALTANPASTTYTPLYAFSNAQLAAVSTSGGGTASNPYILWSNQLGSLAPIFGDMSQWPFEVWEGIYVNATTAHADWAPLPSLSVTYPWWETQFLYTAPATGPLPLTNHLQIYLYHTQNLTIANSGNISGWFASAATTGYSLIANDVQNVLIANNHFNVSNLGLEFTGGGKNNTVWGNTFTPFPQYLNPAQSGVEHPSTGLSDSDTLDHIYNNAFYTNSTASGTSVDFWNVSCQAGYSPAGFFVGGGVPCEPLSYSKLVNGVTLTGCIIGCSYQGGNFWFNYGNEPNPYANLPYVNRATSLTGSARLGVSNGVVGDRGDFAPLIAFSLFEVSFTETGLPTGATWNVTVFNSTGLIYLNTTSTSTSTTLVFYLPNGVYSWGVSPTILSGTRYAASSATGSFTIAGASLSPIAVLFVAAFLVTFTETGLASGRRWYVNITGQRPLYSTTASAAIGLPGSAGGNIYTYQFGVGPGYSTAPLSGSVTVFTSNVAAGPVTFTLLTYGVTFTETGLPTSTSWSVTVGASSPTSTGTTDSFSLTNGTYTYVVPATSGYAANPATGSFSVAGGTVNVPVSFGTAYSATFTETGMPLASAGYAWIVSVAGQPSVTSSASPVVLSLPNGAYAFTIGSTSTYTNPGGDPYTGFAPSPASGTFTVNNAAPTPVSITFSPTVWSVAFVETGLPTGTTWGVTVFDGTSTFNIVGETTSQTSTSSTIVFELTNSTWGYSLSIVSGYTTSQTGSFLLWGAPLAIQVAFAPTPSVHSVTFTESTLPSGTLWWVTLGGYTESSTGTSIAFSEPSGAYNYSVGVGPGYVPSPAAGSVTVSGTDVSVSIAFTAVTSVYSVTFTESGLPTGTSWSVTLNGAIESTTGTTIAFSELSGTYAYSITDVSGWHQTTLPYSGWITVSGASVTEPTLAFTSVTYSAVFSETGLPSGLAWQVTVNGVTEYLTTDGGTDSLTFTGLANGTYSYSVADNAGWHQMTLAYSGSLAVNGGTGPIDGTGVGYAVTLVYTQVTYS
ncbi:MAG: thermopsin family protease, partial [Thermoplasmata archaeon]